MPLQALGAFRGSLDACGLLWVPRPEGPQSVDMESESLLLPISSGGRFEVSDTAIQGRWDHRWYVPRPPNVPLLRALWSLLDGIWGLLKGSWGVLVLRTILYIYPLAPGAARHTRYS